MSRPLVTDDEIDRIKRHAEAEYPQECCGVILVRGSTRLLIPCRNIQNELHAGDPVTHPRDARTAFAISAQDVLKFGRMEADGYQIEVIYHSHIDAGAYFSETDKRNALLGGEPGYPTATYIVCAVMKGKIGQLGAFRWSPAQRDFVSVPLETAESIP